MSGWLQQKVLFLPFGVSGRDVARYEMGLCYRCSRTQQQVLHHGRTLNTLVKGFLESSTNYGLLLEHGT